MSVMVRIIGKCTFKEEQRKGKAEMRELWTTHPCRKVDIRTVRTPYQNIVLLSSSWHIIRGLHLDIIIVSGLFDSILRVLERIYKVKAVGVTPRTSSELTVADQRVAPYEKTHIAYASSILILLDCLALLHS